MVLQWAFRTALSLFVSYLAKAGCFRCSQEFDIGRMRQSFDVVSRVSTSVRQSRNYDNEQSQAETYQMEEILLNLPEKAFWRHISSKAEEDSCILVGTCVGDGKLIALRTT